MRATTLTARRRYPIGLRSLNGAGSSVVTREEIPNWAAQLKEMYDAWMENIDALRAELGDESADDLVDEAHTVGPTLSRRTGVLYTAEKRGRANSN